MANSDVVVRAEARKLFQKTADKRLTEYKKLPVADLQKIIDSIKSGKPGTAKGSAAKGAKSTKGTATTATNGKVKDATEKTKVGKGKATKGSAKGSSPAEKSKSQKTTSKGAAAKGEAKRTTTAGGKGKATAAKGAKGTAKTQKTAEPVKTAKKSNGKIEVIKRSKRKGKFVVPKDYDGTTLLASNGQGRITKAPKRGEQSHRAPLDREAINWQAPWNGGQRGSRAIVLAALREHEGDTVAVFKKLKKKADKMYANVGSPIGGTIESHLRWHINRTAFDYAIGTGQHEPGTRVGYGERKVAAPKAKAKSSKTTKASKSPAKAKVEKKSTKKAAGPQKGAQKPAAGKGKASTKGAAKGAAKKGAAKGKKK